MENKEPTLNERLNGEGARIPKETRPEDIRQGFRRVSTVPTAAPRNYYESIVIYVSGGTRRLYVYDEVTATWRYATLT